MKTVVLGLAFLLSSSILSFSQEQPENCGNPILTVAKLGKPAYLTEDKTQIEIIKRQLNNMKISYQDFTVVLIFFKDQQLSVGVGDKIKVCEKISAQGHDAIRIADYIVPKNI
jgi:hypothetical protein